MNKNIGVFLLILIYFQQLTALAQNNNKIRLNDIKTLTFKKGLNTTRQILPNNLQLQCISNSIICENNEPDVVICDNRGLVDLKIMWNCHADLNNGLIISQVNINCENIDDEFIFVGSCQLKYGLESALKIRRNVRDAYTGSTITAGAIIGIIFGVIVFIAIIIGIVICIKTCNRRGGPIVQTTPVITTPGYRPGYIPPSTVVHHGVGPQVHLHHKPGFVSSSYHAGPGIVHHVHGPGFVGPYHHHHHHTGPGYVGGTGFVGGTSHTGFVGGTSNTGFVGGTSQTGFVGGTGGFDVGNGGYVGGTGGFDTGGYNGAGGFDTGGGGFSGGFDTGGGGGGFDTGGGGFSGGFDTGGGGGGFDSGGGGFDSGGGGFDSGGGGFDSGGGGGGSFD